MGYITRYALEVRTHTQEGKANCEHPFSNTFNYCPYCSAPNIKRYLDLFHDWAENDDAETGGNLDIKAVYFERLGACKWYDHNDDLLKCSKEWPTLRFELSGEGEEPGDLWVNHYVNGKVQKCRAKIVYPEFDESKLE